MATKFSISKSVSKELGISVKDGKEITESFIKLITDNFPLKDIKISGFGVFYSHKSPRRIGRNPKTKESYIIWPMNKLSFKASNKIKKLLN